MQSSNGRQIRNEPQNFKAKVTPEHTKAPNAGTEISSSLKAQVNPTMTIAKQRRSLSTDAPSKTPAQQGGAHPWKNMAAANSTQAKPNTTPLIPAPPSRTPEVQEKLGQVAESTKPGETSSKAPEPNHKPSPVRKSLKVSGGSVGSRKNSGGKNHSHVSPVGKVRNESVGSNVSEQKSLTISYTRSPTNSPPKPGVKHGTENKRAGAVRPQPKPPAGNQSKRSPSPRRVSPKVADPRPKRATPPALPLVKRKSIPKNSVKPKVVNARPLKVGQGRTFVGSDRGRPGGGGLKREGVRKKEASITANQYEEIVLAGLDKWRTHFRKSNAKPLDPEEEKTQADLRKMLQGAGAHARHDPKPEREPQEIHFRSVQTEPSGEESSRPGPVVEHGKDGEKIRRMLKMHAKRASLLSSERRKTVELEMGKRGRVRDRIFSITKHPFHVEGDGGKGGRKKGDWAKIQVGMELEETPKCLDVLKHVTEFNIYKRTEPLEFKTPGNLYCAYNVLDDRGDALFYIGECHNRCFTCAAVSHFLPIYNKDGEFVLFILKRNQHECQLRKSYHLSTHSAQAYIQADEYLQSMVEAPKNSSSPASAFHVRLFNGGFLGHFIETPVDGVKNPYKFKIFDSALREAYQLQETEGSRLGVETSPESSEVVLSKNAQAYLQIYHDHHPIGWIVTGADLGRFGISTSLPISSYRATFPAELLTSDKALILSLTAVSHCESVVEDKQCCLACCYLCFCRCATSTSSKCNIS